MMPNVKWLVQLDKVEHTQENEMITMTTGMRIQEAQELTTQMYQTEQITFANLSQPTQLDPSLERTSSN